MGFCVQVWTFRDSLCLHRLFRSPAHSQSLRTSKCVAYPKKYQFQGRMLLCLLTNLEYLLGHLTNPHFHEFEEWKVEENYRK